MLWEQDNALRRKMQGERLPVETIGEGLLVGESAGQEGPQKDDLYTEADYPATEKDPQRASEHVLWVI